MQSVCTLSVPSQYLSVLIRSRDVSRVQGPCVTSKSTVSASALGLAIYAAAHALLEENLSPPRLASTRLPAGMSSRITCALAVWLSLMIFTDTHTV